MPFHERTIHRCPHHCPFENRRRIDCSISTAPALRCHRTCALRLCSGTRHWRVSCHFVGCATRVKAELNERTSSLLPGQRLPSCFKRLGASLRWRVQQAPYCHCNCPGIAFRNDLAQPKPCHQLGGRVAARHDHRDSRPDVIQNATAKRQARLQAVDVQRQGHVGFGEIVRPVLVGHPIAKRDRRAEQALLLCRSPRACQHRHIRHHRVGVPRPGKTSRMFLRSRYRMAIA